MFNQLILRQGITKSGTIDAVSDLELVGQVQNQSEDALIMLYHRYGTLVYSIAYRVLGNQEDAEEVTQDVFMRLWEKSEQYDSERGQLISWIATITRYSAIDYLRKRQRRTPNQGVTSLDESPDLWETIPVDAGNEELQNRLVSAMLHLSPEQREVIALAYFQGMSQTEIADHVGRPLGTVKSHIRQGMQRLRQIWLSE